MNRSIVASLCNGFELPSPVSASWTCFSLLVNGQAFWGGGGGVGKVREGKESLNRLIVASLCNGFELPSPISARWTYSSLLVNGKSLQEWGWGGDGGGRVEGLGTGVGWGAC